LRDLGTDLVRYAERIPPERNRVPNATQIQSPTRTQTDNKKTCWQTLTHNKLKLDLNYLNPEFSRFKYTDLRYLECLYDRARLLGAGGLRRRHENGPIVTVRMKVNVMGRSA